MTPGCPSLSELADALSQYGAICHQLHSSPDFADLQAVESAFTAADERLGGADGIVVAVGGRQSTRPRPLVSMSESDWRQDLVDPLRTTRHCLQAACRALSGRPARIVLLGPNVSLTGATGFTALVALSEAQRSLMKSAARQWGARGIYLNWLGLDPAVFARDLETASFAATPEMGEPPPALGSAPELSAGVAATIASMIGPHAVTGASIPVDGGQWMVP